MSDGVADKELEEWLFPIKVMLGAQTHKRVRANIIFEVPEQLKKSNVEAYKPKVVSIGPLHRETSRDVLYMEDFKWRCMLSLLHRTKEPIKCLTECGEAILKYDEAVRACYMVPIGFDNNKLAKIMLLDGCFLLELLLISNKEKLNGEGDSEHPVTVETTEEFLSDLKLLENQIPLFIIDLLYKILFGGESDDWISKVINGYALCLFGFSSGPINSPNRAHFLELTHWFTTKDGEQEGAVPNDEQRESMVIRLRKKDGNESNDPAASRDKTANKETKPNLKRCAARLQAAGIKIMPFFPQSSSSAERPKEEPASVPFGCKTKFERQKGELKIQTLHVTEETEVQWRNFIAWEQTKTTMEPTYKKFSQYALLFKGLVCCEYDIELLKRERVLKVYDEKKWNNEKLKKFIDDIASRIKVEDSEDQEFRKMTEDLNKWSKSDEGSPQTDASADLESHLMIRERNGSDKGNCRFIMFKHHCGIILTTARKFCRYLYRLLIRDYCSTPWATLGVMAAVLLLFLTIAQTVLAVLSL